MRWSRLYFPPRVPRKLRRDQTDVVAHAPPHAPPRALWRPEWLNWWCRPARRGGQGGRACRDPRPTSTLTTILPTTSTTALDYDLDYDIDCDP